MSERTTNPKKRQREEEEVTEEKTIPAAPQHENFNKDICDILMELGTVMKNLGMVQKYHVYLKAVHALRVYPRRIESGAQAQKLEGIGKKIGKKIDEILRTGKLQKVEKYRNDPRTTAINLISRIPGIGPKAAKKFVDEEHVKTIEDMRKLESKLNRQQRIGLKYFEDFELKVPRAEVASIEAMIKREANDLDPRLKIEAVGSFRRGLPESGDIDVLITHPDYTKQSKDKKESCIWFSKLIDRLIAKKLIIETFGQGPMQFMGACCLPTKEGEKKNHVRHLDLKIFPMESFFCGLLHFTGSGEHNRQLSIIAQEKGFMLTEFELVPIGSTGVKGEPFPITSEEDIFSYLGVPYRAPSERNM